MDKIKLKRKIENFATNCVMAAVMLTLALNIWSDKGMIWLLVCDIICFAGDTFFAISDWKEIKKMLEDDTNA